MAIILNVREVRDQLLHHADRENPGDGARSTRLLGQMFHEVFGELAAADSPRGWRAAIAQADGSAEAWRAALVDHAYRKIVSRQLERAAPQLGAQGQEVLHFWEAVVALCHWLAEQLWTMHTGKRPLDEIERTLKSELPLCMALREPGWTDDVELRGLADAILSLPDKGAWCVAELKLGQTMPDVDLGQAALYHMMLSADGRTSNGQGTLAVVSFKPACEEQLYPSARLAEATTQLKRLIGRMAGVLPSETPPQETPATATELGEPPTQEQAASVPARAPAPLARPAAAPLVLPPRPTAQPLAWGVATEEHQRLGKDLRRVLESHGIGVKVDDAPVLGPTFIRFFLQPQRGVSVKKFNRLEQDVALGLSLKTPPSIGRIRGRIAVDIERPDRQPVPYAELRDRLPPLNPLFGSGKLLLGVDLDGNVEFADLSQPEHCHVLVAGTAGSGKSQWLRAALLGLVEANTPETLQLVLIDPKRNAFTAWRESPFLRQPLVFPDDTPVTEVLGDLIEEMENRYRRMENADDLRQLVAREGSPIPRIVCMCDEFADLLLSVGKEERKQIEQQVGRLGAKARASGIHLILATQRPARDIVNGTIKANLPARVSLSVASHIEAKLMDTPGAENLLGRGDLYFKAIGEPKRLQGALVSEEDMERLARNQPEPELSAAT